jgi:hypothetical protein
MFLSKHSCRRKYTSSIAERCSNQHLALSSCKLNNTIAQIDWNGLIAQLSGQVTLPAESTAATQVWVAAVAYDKDGRVVGVKRWEGGAIQPGGSITFSFLVSSLGSAIDAVEFMVEAQ